MTDYTEAAAELRRIEQMVAEQFAKVPAPKAPDIQPDDYAADDTRPSELVENLTCGLAAVAVPCLFIFGA